MLCNPLITGFYNLPDKQNNSSMPLSIEELKKIPYLDAAVVQGRMVKLMPLWDGTRWRIWFDTEIGIVEGQIVDTLEGDYVGTTAAKQTDLFIPFVHLMWQHASFPEVAQLIIAISDDFHNMGTSVAKLKYFWRFREHIERGGAVRFASTELEYLVALCRTVFDLLQELISRIWAGRVRLTDEKAEAFRKSRSLPETFSRMVLENKEHPRSAEQIASKFGLPSTLAEQYALAAPFFAQLRRVRDKVLHSGGSFRGIYETERGFCVNPAEAPYKDFTGWLPDHQYNDNTCSVLPWIADVVMQTIDVCNSLMTAFGQTILLPPALAPGYLVFVRGPHNKALASLLDVSSGKAPWWNREIDESWSG